MVTYEVRSSKQMHEKIKNLKMRKIDSEIELGLLKLRARTTRFLYQ